MTASFDCVVIGAGPGGYVAAIRAAQLGLKTAIVEKEPVLGGTCLRVGCIPSKVLLESSEQFRNAGHLFEEHGITAENVSFDLAKILERKVKIVKELTDGLGFLMKKNKITVYRGRAKLAGSGQIEITDEKGDPGPQLRGDHVILATGSVPAALPDLPFDGRRVVSSTEALSFPQVPENLLVVGAGAIGLELGSVWARWGAKVVVVELLPRIVPFADPALSQLLQRALKKQGLDIRTKTEITNVQVGNDGVEVILKDKKGKTEQLRFDRVLVAVGRKPCTEGLGLEEAGVKLDEKGRVAVDDHFSTTKEKIYAIGDLIPGPMLAHKAEEEGVAVAELIAGKAGHVSYRTIPCIVYTDPELAQVGLTEPDAKELGLPYKVGKFAFKPNGRAKSLGRDEGMVKLIAHQETDELLGAHILGPHASEIISELVVALELYASGEDVARTVHAHPTLSEVVKEAALSLDGRTIHG